MIKPQAFGSGIDVKQFFEASVSALRTKANPLRREPYDSQSHIGSENATDDNPKTSER